MAIIKVFNEFWKLYYVSVPKKEYIINKLAVKVLKQIYVWIKNKNKNLISFVAIEFWDTEFNVFSTASVPSWLGILV